jgi:hypothetical protein
MAKVTRLASRAYCARQEEAMWERISAELKEEAGGGEKGRRARRGRGEEGARGGGGEGGGRRGRWVRRGGGGGRGWIPILEVQF